MDAATIVTAVTSSLGISVASAAWLSQSLVSHRLDKDLEAFKSDLERTRNADHAAIEGRIHQQVETSLADLAAGREYEWDARKRLYTAIGPLRFQLLLAARDLAGRLQSYGLGRRYDLASDGYYGRSTLYRILRPLCLSELIERQIAYADFGVDSGAVDLLRFKKNALAAFSGGSLVEGHPDANWNSQVQHVFFDYLGRSANALIVCEEHVSRAMRFHEFEAKLDAPHGGDSVEPFPAILAGLTPESKPLFWVRLVAYGHLCNDFINRAGAAIGFEKRLYPVRELLQASRNPVILQALDEYVRRCDQLLRSSL